MPTAEVEPGVELRYVDTGGEDPVVLVHGGFMSGALWEYQVEALGDDHRLIVPDLRGHGDSDAPYGRYTEDLFADDIAGLLDHLGLDGVTYVGWSLGATVGVALMPDDRIDRLVLTSSGIFHGLAAHPDDPSGGLDFDRLVEDYRSDRPAAMRPFVESMFHADVSDDLLEWVWSITLETPLHVALDVLDIYADMDYAALSDAAGGIEVPVTIMQGAHDAAATVDEAERVAAEVFPDARCVAFEHSGHAPFIEERERFTAELRTALERNG